MAKAAARTAAKGPRGQVVDGLGWVDPTLLVPWEDNPRDNDDAVSLVADSIERFGFGAPLVVQQGSMQVVAGHTRLKAALRLGLGKVPVRVLDITDEQAAALALADNKLGEAARWDDAALAKVLKGLQDSGAELEGLGWADDELDTLLGSLQEGATTTVRQHERRLDVDDPGAQDPPKKPDSVVGKVYRLGPHVLICGDSSDEGLWRLGLEALGVGAVDAVWTDAPYGVDYAGGSTPSKSRDNHTIQGDQAKDEDLADLLRGSLGPAYQYTQPGGVWYVAAPPGDHLWWFLLVLRELPGTWRHTLSWVKDAFVMGRADYHYQHETILYGWKAGAAHTWLGDRKQTSVRSHPKPRVSKYHPTMKPVELVRELLGHHLEPGRTVVDPFGGSGTTLIAAAQLSCRALLFEVDPRYADAIRTRWALWAKDAGVDVGDGLKI